MTGVGTTQTLPDLALTSTQSGKADIGPSEAPHLIAAAMFPPSTVVTSPVVLSASAW